MELSERQFIMENMYSLVEMTTVNTSLLSKLQSENILSKSDLMSIDALQTNTERAWRLYSILPSRVNSYNILIHALVYSRQTGAVDILERINYKESFMSFLHGENITYDSKDLLGTGSTGATTYKGKFGSHVVAVKVIQPKSKHVKQLKLELKILTKLDYCENLVRYFAGEFDSEQNVCLLAMDYCQMSLYDWIVNKTKADDSSAIVISKLDVLHQTTKGLAFLHKRNVLNRNLGPTNVLFRIDAATRKVLVKLSFFSPLYTNDGYPAKLTSATDVLNLGHVFCFVATDGKYKFKDLLESEKIVASSFPKSPELLEYFSDSEFYQRGGFSLTKSMMCEMEPKRPPTSQILFHPLFWDENKILQFVVDLHEVLRQKNSRILLHFQEFEQKFLHDSSTWKGLLSPKISTYLQSNPNKYKGSSIKDLLRLIRNMAMHFQSEPEYVRNEIGELPVRFIQYWTSRFPWLVISSWVALQDCKNELPGYYGDGNYKFTE